jgi:transcriptional regulator with XRE-family HTH domain
MASGSEREELLKRQGALIRNLRERRSLSQSQLGDKCGIPQYKISRIETGSNAAKAKDLELIFRALGKPRVNLANVMVRGSL